MKRGGREEELGALRLAVALYVVVFALKLGVYFVTGAMALLAEALHTLSDIIVSGFLWVAAILSRKRADRDHAFGHARAENVGALVAATLFLSFTSLKLYEDAIPRLFRSEHAPPENLPWAVGVLLLSMVVAAAPMAKLLVQKQRGPAARAQLMELFNDQLGLLAAMAGILLTMRGHALADPVAALVVATIIAVNGVRLFAENSSFLLGRSPGPEFLEEAKRIALSVPGVLDVHDLRAEQTGPPARPNCASSAWPWAAWMNSSSTTRISCASANCPPGSKMPPNLWQSAISAETGAGLQPIGPIRPIPSPMPPSTPGGSNPPTPPSSPMP